MIGVMERHRSRRQRRGTWLWPAAGMATSVVLGALSRIPDVPGGPEPAGIPSDLRPAATLGAIAVAVIGFGMAIRSPATGGAVAAFGAVLAGAVAAFAYHPLVAAGAAALLLIPAGWIIATHAAGIRRWLSGAVVTALLAAGAVVAGIGYQFAYGPTHPSSRLPGPPEGAVRWVWAGGVTADRAVVRAKAADPDRRIALRLSPPDGTVTSTRSGDATAFTLTGLTPGRRYRYAVVAAGGADDRSGHGEFRTFPSGPASFTVAFSSCARTGSNGAVFDAIRAESPLIYLNLGDMYYADITDDDPGRFRHAFDGTLTRPAQANLYRSTAIAYVWDDHDYGENNADGTSPSRPAAHRVYRQYVPHYPLGVSGSAAPISQAFTIGRVRFIMTDSRSEKTPKSAPDDTRKTMLGARQRDWLERELTAANGRYPVIVWVNPLPWVGGPGAGADWWGGYATERRAIANFIARNRIRGLVMLSGDSHSIALDDGTHTGYADGETKGFPMLMAGALDRTGHRKGGPYSHGQFPGGGHYGTMKVADDGGPSITVTLTGRDWQRREVTSLRFRFPAKVSGG
jgi:hypothetical protein